MFGKRKKQFMGNTNTFRRNEFSFTALNISKSVADKKNISKSV